MLLHGLNNIYAGFGACIIKCTILPNFGFKKLHLNDRNLKLRSGLVPPDGKQIALELNDTG
jgi:hypothetical protein